MKISDAIYLLKLSRTHITAGRFMQAAETALNAQRTAMQCRSAKRFNIAHTAHCYVVTESDKAVLSQDKSRGGQIRKESTSIGWTANNEG